MFVSISIATPAKSVFGFSGGVGKTTLLELLEHDPCRPCFHYNSQYTMGMVISLHRSQYLFLQATCIIFYRHLFLWFFQAKKNPISTLHRMEVRISGVQVWSEMNKLPAQQSRVSWLQASARPSSRDSAKPRSPLRPSQPPWTPSTGCTPAIFLQPNPQHHIFLKKI